jgi:hypothetical protein
MESKQITKWREIRAHGRRSFLLRYGILRAGAFFATLSAMVDYFREYGFTSNGVKSYLAGVGLYFGWLFNCIFLGVCMGLFVWFVNERSFLSSEMSKGRRVE